MIYDAAHAFGVRDGGGSVLSHGDLSVLSFHATKVFNTFEGGAIICPDARTKQRIDHLKNFGFVDEVTVVAPGINGKMSEFNAAFGLLQLKHIDRALARRAQIDALYRAPLAASRAALPGAPAERRRQLRLLPGDGRRVSAAARTRLYQLMRTTAFPVRRYFYPLISEFPMYRGLPSAAPGNLPVASTAARQVLCLPIFPSMSDADVERVAAAVVAASGSGRSVAATRLTAPASRVGSAAAVL